MLYRELLTLMIIITDASNLLAKLLEWLLLLSDNNHDNQECKIEEQNAGIIGTNSSKLCSINYNSYA